MAAKPRITIVGAGNLGSALGTSLRKAGYKIDSIVARAEGGSLRKAQSLAREVGSGAVAPKRAKITSDVVWFCVPDAQIAYAAEALAAAASWRGRVALHSSGALTSDELNILRRHGAAVASVHPLMTFVHGSRPALAGVSFAIEGDAPAVRVARHMVRDLGGIPCMVRKADKAAYHAWGTFASPLLAALLAATERVAAAAGVRGKGARKRMLPILRQTLANYSALGAADAFSGPIVRGDVEVVKYHLRVLRSMPAVRGVYLALARAALQYLPAKNGRLLRQALR